METQKGRLSRSVGSSPVPSSSSCNLLCFRVSCFEGVGLIWFVFCIVWRSNHGKPIKKAAFFVMLSLSFCSTVFFFNILFSSFLWRSAIDVSSCSFYSLALWVFVVPFILRGRRERQGHPRPSCNRWRARDSEFTRLGRRAFKKVLPLFDFLPPPPRSSASEVKIPPFLLSPSVALPS